MITFGENIYLWRFFKGFTQQELAKKTGIPRPNLSAIESGKREVSLGTLRALALAFGVTAGMLADGIAPPSFKKREISRESLEGIVKMALVGKKKLSVLPQKNISRILAGVTTNRVNAAKGRYSNTLGRRSRDYDAGWLLLEASLGRETVNNLLSRLDKHLGLG